jgi:hypothetical protein
LVTAGLLGPCALPGKTLADNEIAMVTAAK